MPTLITIPFSHFCEKARWALDCTGASYREEGHAPMFHKRAVYGASGKLGSVPVLLLDDGTVLDDSPLIVRWADAQATSERKLLPSGGRERDDALGLERHFDANLGPHTRRIAYFHLLADRARVVALMGVDTPPAERRIVRLGFPLLRAVMRRAMRIDAKGAARSRDKVHLVFDEIAKRLADGRPYLTGDRFGVADLVFSALASPLLLPDQHPMGSKTATLEVPEGLVAAATAMRETPAGQFALKMYREHRVD